MLRPWSRKGRALNNRLSLTINTDLNLLSLQAIVHRGGSAKTQQRLLPAPRRNIQNRVDVLEMPQNTEALFNIIGLILLVSYP